MRDFGDFRAGFVSFVGRPNVGKSTLTNALVGEKIAITSNRPQTTRRAIRGVVHRPDGQLIIVDTPGIHRPRTLLGERLNALVETTLGDVDVIGFCVPANEKIGPGDRFIFERLSDYPHAKKVAIVTKVDRASKAEVYEHLAELGTMCEWDAVVPLSSVTREQLDVLEEELLKLMPLSPPLYGEEQITEETTEVRIAELIREAALEGVRDELPHSLAVVIDEMSEQATESPVTIGEDAAASIDGDAAAVPPLDIYASLLVERDSQKGIIIGSRGSKLADIRRRAKRNIQRVLGQPVVLHLHVKVAKDWQSDPKALGKLGF